MSVLTEISEVNQVSEGLELVSEACGSFFRDRGCLWDEFPSGWNSQMVDSIIEECMDEDLPEGCTEGQLVALNICGTNQFACQDRHCGLEDLDTTQACDTDQFDSPRDICSMDLRCISIDNQLATPMGTSVLEKSDSADPLPTLQETVDDPKDPMASMMEYCVLSTPRKRLADIPPSTSPQELLEAATTRAAQELLEAASTRAAAAVSAVVSKLKGDIPHVSPQQANSKTGCSIDPAVANSPIGLARGGSIDLSMANPVPQSGSTGVSMSSMGGGSSGSTDLPIANSLPRGGSISGSIDLAVANSFPRGGSISGSIDLAVANSLPQGNLGGSIDLAVARSVSQGAVQMQGFSVRHPNTDGRQMVSSAQPVQDRHCRPLEAAKSARFPNMQRSQPESVVTFCIGSETSPSSGSGSGGVKPMCFNMSPRVRDKVLLFERHNRNTPGAVSHRAVVRPNMPVGAMGGRMGISSGPLSRLRKSHSGSLVMESGKNAQNSMPRENTGPA